MVLPPDLVRPVDKLAQNMYISAPTVSQIAAITVDHEPQSNCLPRCSSESDLRDTRTSHSHAIQLLLLSGI